MCFFPPRNLTALSGGISSALTARYHCPMALQLKRPQDWYKFVVWVSFTMQTDKVVYQIAPACDILPTEKEAHKCPQVVR